MRKLFAICMLLFPLATLAQTIEWSACPRGLLLDEHPLRELTPDGANVLSTTLDVRPCSTGSNAAVPCPSVPEMTKSGDKWTCRMITPNIPLYGSPDASGKLTYGFPAPTLRIRKADSETTLGSRLTIRLQNHLTPGDDAEACIQQTPLCDCSRNPKPQCCLANTDKAPNCFHGFDATNLHFHGLHVSPQSPQDYVLLELRPFGATSGAHAHMEGPAVTPGEFTYDVSPLRWEQPEGTHWYHPHKHGSTAEQVGAGMAGALIVEGAFDRKLRDYYGGKLAEKVLVIQQIHTLNFLTTAAEAVAPFPLVNGLLEPTIVMRAGETQRWRFIDATIEASAQLRIGLASKMETKQIAMDGIQFHPDNYASQPLQNSDGTIDLSPGNRADFLVKAPRLPGTYDIRYTVFGRVENQSRAVKSKQRQTLRSANTVREDVGAFLRALPETPTLLHVVVVPCVRDCESKDFPSKDEFPAMPAYLDDLPATSNTRNLTFALLDEKGQPGKSGAATNQFFINFSAKEKRQFDPKCVDISAQLGTVEQWTLNQNVPNTFAPGRPFHVFHIHINPFQVLDQRKLAHPIWQDSITLPDTGSVTVRQKFTDFTGRYVLHCHFLGHEDRGMMLGVQTICPKAKPGDPDRYANPVLTGDECAGTTFPATPICGPRPAK
jgi:FtsP/CotA-like multicopper oxidase with cupredoxin domain